ncbi:terminase large subunit domain-containing protein [Mycobacterium sp. SMC-2]|uniref:terminase large subunit domain-containing protein n=1 Tax=Mycobacterium sp. SMC-2 TaxID=2857058 RepID=UPI0021B2B2E9|nr:terminase large subunit [Mycobacterium sp. SMC-2]
MAELRRGVKAKADPSPLPFNTRLKGSKRFAKFVRDFIITPKGRGVNQPMKLRPWQVDLMASVLDAERRPSIAGFMLPRGQGKTTLMAAWAIYELFCGPDGNQIVVTAVDERQAKLTFSTAARMIELNDELAKRCLVYRERLELPAKGSSFVALPAEPKRLEGLGNFTLAIVDEIGVVARETWQTILLGLGKMDDATVCGIGTPPVGDDSVLFDLRNHAREHPDDDSFVWREYSAAGFEDHPVDCRHCWYASNPAMDPEQDPFLFERDLLALLGKVTEASFRRARLCQLPFDVENALVDPDTWRALSTDVGIPDGTDVVIALDGSHNRDCTALLIGSISATPHFDTLAVYSNTGQPGWKVDVLAVEQKIRDACKRWNVKELVMDPFRWNRTGQVLAGEGLTVHEFPWSPQRVTKATTELHGAILNKNLSHSGDAQLRDHVLAATVHETDNGLRIGKVSRSEKAPKIDLAAALVMCHSRCVWLGTKPQKRKRTASFA